MILSSYAVNNYAEVFRAMVDAYKPKIVVELGCLHGYSSVALAQGLLKNAAGEIHIYDLFEDYPYKHGTMGEVEEALKNLPGSVQYKIQKMNAYQVADLYPDHSVCMLHVDLSNTGETVKKIMDQWDQKMVYGGVILFEGGTEESDQVEWRVKYGAPSIKKEIETNAIIQANYVYGTYLKWPGLTMLLKKR